MSYLKSIVAGLSRLTVNVSRLSVAAGCNGNKIGTRLCQSPTSLTASPVINITGRFLSHLTSSFTSNTLVSSCARMPTLLQPMQLVVQPSRNRIVYSRRGGRPRTVRAVIHRFFRLHNGLWIRPRAGRHKRRWTKTLRRLARLQQHVVCNRKQCQLLDAMVNIEWKRPKYYVDDPYAPYHRKSNLPDYRYQPPKFLP